MIYSFYFRKRLTGRNTLTCGRYKNKKKNCCICQNALHIALASYSTAHLLQISRALVWHCLFGIATVYLQELHVSLFGPWLAAERYVSSQVTRAYSSV